MKTEQKPHIFKVQIEDKYYFEYNLSMDNKIANYIKSNYQKTYIITLVLVFAIENVTFQTDWEDQKIYWYVSILLLGLVLYSYFIIFYISDIKNKSTFMKILYASPLLFLYYFNLSPIIFDVYYSETLFSSWSFYQNEYMSIWILLVLRLLIISVAISLFNIFWIERYKSYINVSGITQSTEKWKRYNIIARIFFGLSINSAFLVYFSNPFIYDYELFFDYSGMSIVFFAFIFGGFYYVLLDWFSEVLRLLSKK